VPGIVFHHQHADRADVDKATGNELAGVGHQHVDGIAVFGQRVRHEPVVAGIGHRRVQEAIHDQRARFLVHLVLDGLAAVRDFDDDVHVLRGIVADGNRVDSHEICISL